MHAGRASFITGQSVFRTGLSKVGMPGADVGLQAEDVTIAELLKPLGYATGQFGKNHLGDLNKYLPTAHGFDKFFGNLYPPRQKAASFTIDQGGREARGRDDRGPLIRDGRPPTRWAAAR